MLYSHLLVGAFLTAALVHSVPTRRDGKGFSSQCEDLQLNGEWLVGNCLTGKNDSERIVSAVYLGTKITNDNGELKWQRNGEYQQHCQQCNLTDSKTLSCNCQPIGTGLNATTLNLEERIISQGGHLLANLDGESQRTPQDNQVQVPQNFNFSLALGTEKDCNPGFAVSNTRPLDCYVFPLTSDSNMVYLSGKFDAGKYWTAEVYDSEKCDGRPLGRFKEEDQDKCKNFKSKGMGIKITPLFNADW